MLTPFLLALREGIEAALVIGIVLGALRQLRRPDCAQIVWAAVASAVTVSVLAAFLLNLLGWSLAGPAEPIFEGLTLFAAAGLLTWMLFWMRRQSQPLREELHAGVCEAVCSPGRRGVFVLTFVAVAREGVELALFLTAAAVDANATEIVTGALTGLTAAALLGWALFATTVRLDLRRFFQFTGAVLILFAAGLVAKGVHELNEVGWIPAIVEPIWNTRAVLSERSGFGAVLKSLFGYTSGPSLTAVLAYAAYFGAIALGLRSASASRARGAGEHGTSLPPPMEASPLNHSDGV